MFAFIGLLNIQKKKTSISRAVEKMNKAELTVEDILDESELVNEMRSYTYSQIMNL